MQRHWREIECDIRGASGVKVLRLYHEDLASAPAAVLLLARLTKAGGDSSPLDPAPVLELFLAFPYFIGVAKKRVVTLLSRPPKHSGKRALKTP